MYVFVVNDWKEFLFFRSQEHPHYVEMCVRGYVGAQESHDVGRAATTMVEKRLGLRDLESIKPRTIQTSDPEMWDKVLTRPNISLWKDRPFLEPQFLFKVKQRTAKEFSYVYIMPWTSLFERPPISQRINNQRTFWVKEEAIRFYLSERNSKLSWYFKFKDEQLNIFVKYINYRDKNS